MHLAYDQLVSQPFTAQSHSSSSSSNCCWPVICRLLPQQLRYAWVALFGEPLASICKQKTPLPVSPLNPLSADKAGALKLLFYAVMHDCPHCLINVTESEESD